MGFVDDSYVLFCSESEYFEYVRENYIWDERKERL